MKTSVVDLVQGYPNLQRHVKHLLKSLGSADLQRSKKLEIELALKEIRLLATAATQKEAA